MIRNETEYKEAVQRIGEEKERFAKQAEVLRADGRSPQEIKRLMDPILSFHEQLAEEVKAYERLRRGELDEVHSLRSMGQLLISLRIASALTQRELADLLGVHESQVSRDERNEYHGITLERAARILEALGVRVHCKVELPQNKEPVPA
jgi:DNA-directed RNA polymerase specialized sigma subunit